MHLLEYIQFSNFYKIISLLQPNRVETCENVIFGNEMKNHRYFKQFQNLQRYSDTAISALIPPEWESNITSTVEVVEI